MKLEVLVCGTVGKITACLLCATQLMLAAPAFAGALAPAKAQIKGGPGIHTATFTTPQGKVFVVLPDDLAPGDTVSATLRIEPQDGQSLERHTLRMGETSNPVHAGIAKFVLPPLRQNGFTELLLRDESGSEIGRASLPLASAAAGLPDGIRLPREGNPGQPLVIPGRFDGDATNTQVRVAGAAAPVLAESPRKLIVESPNEPNKKTEIEVREGDQTARGEFKNEKPRRKSQLGKTLLIVGIVAVVLVVVISDAIGDGLEEGFGGPYRH